MKRKVNFKSTVDKFTTSQLSDLLNFYEFWLLTEPEVTRRTNLIQNIISDYSSISPWFDKYLKLKGTTTNLKFINIFAHLKPITDEMLHDCIDGLIEFLFYQKSKIESHSENCENLMRPSFNKFKEFLESEIWRLLIIGEEITGEDYQLVNGVHIPFSADAILKHINRIGELPMTANDIQSILSDFRKHNQKIYGHEDNNTGLAFLKDIPDYEIDFNKLSKIYDLCLRYDIFKGKWGKFVIAVSLANFSIITFNIKYKAQHLIYRLSKIIIPQQWYTDAVISLGWDKSECSGHKERLSDDKWAIALERLTPDRD